jgi:hypothetical protein
MADETMSGDDGVLTRAAEAVGSTLGTAVRVASGTVESVASAAETAAGVGRHGRCGDREHRRGGSARPPGAEETGGALAHGQCSARSPPGRGSEGEEDGQSRSGQTQVRGSETEEPLRSAATGSTDAIEEGGPRLPCCPHGANAQEGREEDSEESDGSQDHPPPVNAPFRSPRRRTRPGDLPGHFFTCSRLAWSPSLAGAALRGRRGAAPVAVSLAPV